MIEFLDIDETYYIENDKVKLHLNEDFTPKQGTWDKVWADVLKNRCLKICLERIFLLYL